MALTNLKATSILLLVNTLEAIQNAPNNQKLKAKVDNNDINELKL